MDCTPIGFERSVTPFSESARRAAAGPLIPDLPRANIASGASIVSGEAYALVDAV
ncbi:MAG: hypothetical protein R3C16_09950 [Hyphomonadaceae bacterium]